MPSLKRPIRACVGVCLVAVAVQVVVMALPPTAAPLPAHTSMLSTHLLLELFAIVIAGLIVTVSWHTFDVQTDRSAHVVIGGFLVVATCDLVHVMTYEGMPAFLGPSGTERAIFFWLMGRSMEVVVFGLIAAGWSPARSRAQSLSLGAVVSLVLLAWGSWRPDLFPTTFVSGGGVTAFKAQYEVLICLANLAIAVVLWRRARARNDLRYYLMATSSWVIGVGELSFTNYVAPTDFQNLFGHFYKIAGYGLLYMATFVQSLGAPFEALRQYQRELSDLTRQLMAQEKETTSRLAQGLHDQLGQTLTAIRLDFVSEARLADPSQAQRHERVDRLIDQAIAEVRQVLVDLRPTLLEEHGLAAALDNELRSRSTVAEGVQLHLDAPDGLTTQRWHPDVEYAAFMIAREAIGNALRHARATAVKVALRGDAQHLQLDVSDDGGGLRPEDLEVRPGHLGMIGMRERSAAIGAQFSASAPEQGGTSVSLAWKANDT